MTGGTYMKKQIGAAVPKRPRQKEHDEDKER
jgi:hypothetical protein